MERSVKFLVFVLVLLMLPGVGFAQADRIKRNKDSRVSSVQTDRGENNYVRHKIERKRRNKRKIRKQQTKCDCALTQLCNEYKAHRRGAFKPKCAFLQVTDDMVVIDAVASGDTDTLKADLEALGMQNAKSCGRFVSGRLPITAIDKIGGLNSLKFARPFYAMTRAGTVHSQGDASMHSDYARISYGMDGSGVSVGVISDTFSNFAVGVFGTPLTTWGHDITNGELPGGIVLLDDTAPPRTDEGRALAQIIYDVAPGADFAFHTGGLSGTADLAMGIRELAGCPNLVNGCFPDQGGFVADIITDDVIIPTEPMFQDGVIAQAVDAVTAAGVTYLSAAGNEARASYESTFNAGNSFPIDTYARSASGMRFWGGTAHDFNGSGDYFQSITVPANGFFQISFQWDEPFASNCSGCPGSSSDIDIYILEEPPTPGTQVLAGSVNSNIGFDALEVFSYDNDTGQAITINIMIVINSGSNPNVIKYVRSQGWFTTDEYDTASGTIYGHPNAAGAITVGAASYWETPEYGIDPALREPFSSAGGVKILFDKFGNRLGVPPIDRFKPDIVAPTDGNTTFFFPGFDNDGDQFPNFGGTSGAVPHAAGVAALMLQKFPALTTDQVRVNLVAGALDMGAAGFDYDTGNGLIQAILTPSYKR